MKKIWDFPGSSGFRDSNPGLLDSGCPGSHLIEEAHCVWEASEVQDREVAKIATLKMNQGQHRRHPMRLLRAKIRCRPPWLCGIRNRAVRDRGICEGFLGEGQGKSNDEWGDRDMSVC